MGWSGSYGSWYGRRRGSLGGMSEVRSEVKWYCQKCGTGNGWSRTDCRHCASVTNDAPFAPETSAQEKIAVLEKTLGGMGNDEPILAGKRVLEKELEKLQRKLNGPKNTAKHIRERKAGGDAREPQSTKRNFESGSRGVQDSPRGPACCEKENRWTKTRATSCLRRTRKKFEFSASKRPAGRTRDGSVEEIAGWMLEAQRLNREVEAKKRKLQVAIEKESGKDARMGDDSTDGLDGSLSS